MNSPRCRIGIWGLVCSKYRSTNLRPSCVSGKGAGLIVGFECNPKNESLIVLPPPLAASAVSAFLLAARSEPVCCGTELLTAAKTTLANEMPDADPRALASEVPCTETLPRLLTSLSTFSSPASKFGSMAGSTMACSPVAASPFVAELDFFRPCPSPSRTGNGTLMPGLMLSSTAKWPSTGGTVPPSCSTSSSRPLTRVSRK